MKRMLVIIITVSLFISCASADSINLSGMSLAELVALKDQINLAIWNCQEWQEVSVPLGIWKVGEDIPAGHWTVHAPEEWFTKVSFGDTLKPSGTEIKVTSYFGFELITSPTYSGFDKKKDVSEFSFTVKKGDYIEVEFGAAIFTPYSGKPDLGFK